VSRTHLFQANRFGGVCGWVVQWFGGSVVQWVAVAFSAAAAAVSWPLLFAAILQFSFASSPSRFFSAKCNMRANVCSLNAALCQQQFHLSSVAELGIPKVRGHRFSIVVGGPAARTWPYQTTICVSL